MDARLFKIGFVPVNIADVADVLLVAVLLYRVYGLVGRNPTLQRAGLGLVSLFVFWRLIVIFNLTLLNLILEQLVQLGSLALVVIFAPELRRLFYEFGPKIPIVGGLAGQIVPADKPERLDELLSAIEYMSEHRIGALIVLLSRKKELAPHIKNGETVEIPLTKSNLTGIFDKTSVYHDGACVIFRDQIIAVRCVLPLSDDPDFPQHLGTRHRAALGLSELTNHGVIVVSEQTGQTSFALHGHLKRNLSTEELRQTLDNFYRPVE
ncbi:MAG: diadenylate cyclase [Bacteroidia bacterium]|nr:diadenylate cyclase [Bacteroidia bacterium]MDW8333519.1 diadenylate cyclase [Bacteroidia bacterium]